MCMVNREMERKKHRIRKKVSGKEIEGKIVVERKREREIETESEREKERQRASETERGTHGDGKGEEGTEAEKDVKGSE